MVSAIRYLNVSRCEDINLWRHTSRAASSSPRRCSA